ncbi:MAG: MFS transporter [Rhodothermales bacterium]|nr:MFS transporter [Rhodothermales bacterium]
MQREPDMSAAGTSRADDESPGASTKGSGRILAVLFLGVLMAAMDIAILGPALPAIQETFGLTERVVSWAFNAWVFANLVGVPIMSKLADIFGRRNVYLFDIGLFAVGATVVAISPNFTVLLVGRCMQGFAVSGVFPVAGAVVGDAVPPERRGRAFGVLGSVFGVAFIIGPILAGLMLMLGWRWLYLVYIPLALMVIVFGFFVLRTTRQTERRPIDWKGLAALAAALFALAYALSMMNTDDLVSNLTDPRIMLSLGAVLLLLPLFVRFERGAADPVLRLDLLRSRQVALACLLATGAGISEASFIYFPSLAVLAYGVDASAASFMLLPLVVAVAVGSPIAGRLLDRVGSRAIVLGGYVLLAAGMAGIAAAPGNRTVFYGSSVLIGLGLAALMGSALSYILLHEARKAERAVSQGIITLFISIGQLLAGAAVGAAASSAVDRLSGFQGAFWGIAVFCFLMLIAGAFLKSRRRERQALYSES